MISVEEARNILGEEAETLTDQQLEQVIASFDFLADKCLEMFEVKVFKQPLRKVLDNATN